MIKEYIVTCNYCKTKYDAIKRAKEYPVIYHLHGGVGCPTCGQSYPLKIYLNNKGVDYDPYI